MVFTTADAARMWRWKGWDIEEFNEILDMKDASVRLNRMKDGGAPLLDNHDRWRGFDSQIGVVERAWIEGDELKGLVRFSKKARAEELWKEVKDGIIRNGSIGYRVHKYKDETKEDEKIKTLRAVDWEPVEMSLVTVPADPRAGVREIQARSESDYNTVEINLKGDRMEGNKPETNPAQEKMSNSEKDKVSKTERERGSKILRATRLAGLPQEFAEELIEKNISVEKAQELILEKWSENEAQKESKISTPGADVQITRDEADTKREAAVESLLHRFRPAEHAITERAKQYSYMTLKEIAIDCLKRRGFHVHGMSPNEIAKRAFHSTSDFPYILENVLGKRIRASYMESKKTFLPIVRETTAKDFKPMSIVQLGAMPALEKKVEGATLKYGTVGEGKETYAIATYENGLAVTRETIINDDLNALMKIGEGYGMAAASLESDVTWSAITSNPNMGDGLALFVAGHNNLQSAAALDETELGKMKAAMRKQTNDKGRYLNLEPKYLAVNPDNETVAKKLLAQQSQEGGFNIHGGEFDLIIEPRIASTAYYVFADVNLIDLVEIAYLEGARGLQINQELDFDTKGIKISAGLDFAAKSIDWRGMQYNPGA